MCHSTGRAGMKPHELLRLHPFFSSLSEGDAQQLLQQTRCKRFEAGREIFHKDDPGDGLYGVLEGSVAFTVDSVDGRELTLNVLGTGEFFGEIALLDGKGRSATAVARDTCELLFLPRTEFLRFFSERPQAMIGIIELMCEHLRRATDHAADTAFLDLSKRLAKRLVWLLDAAPAPADLRISHAELASMLGVSRERVTRQLSAWSDQGILDQGRGRIVVRDRGALEHVVARRA
jgi:CRP/FNR family cyclic AMP-dependent transcriptional regulator